MFLENIKEAITSIFSNKMRSILTMLGIIIGISHNADVLLCFVILFCKVSSGIHL